VDDHYIIDELKELVREAKDSVVTVYWIPINIKAHEKFNKRIKKSIGYYREWLPKLAKSHNVDLECIKEFRIDICRKRNHQIEITFVVIDDRNKELSGVVQN
jgi:hypothetical protein